MTAAVLRRVVPVALEVRAAAAVAMFLPFRMRGPRLRLVLRLPVTEHPRPALYRQAGAL